MSEHQDGLCPCCGNEISYVGSYDHDDDGAMLEWECDHCGASGKAGFNLAFDQYYNIKDGNGNSVE